MEPHDNTTDQRGRGVERVGRPLVILGVPIGWVQQGRHADTSGGGGLHVSQVRPVPGGGQLDGAVQLILVGGDITHIR